MKKNKILSLALTSMCVFVASVFIGYMGQVIFSGAPILRRVEPTHTPLPASNTFAELAIPADASLSEDYEPIEVHEDFYVMRENDGRIGVFAYRNGEPHFLYNIDRLVRFLPESDQELLRQGIVLYTREELTMLEEDFGS